MLLLLALLILVLLLRHPILKDPDERDAIRGDELTLAVLDIVPPHAFVSRSIVVSKNAKAFAEPINVFAGIGVQRAVSRGGGGGD